MIYTDIFGAIIYFFNDLIYGLVAVMTFASLIFSYLYNIIN